MSTFKKQRCYRTDKTPFFGRQYQYRRRKGVLRKWLHWSTFGRCKSTHLGKPPKVSQCESGCVCCTGCYPTIFRKIKIAYILAQIKKLSLVNYVLVTFSYVLNSIKFSKISLKCGTTAISTALSSESRRFCERPKQGMILKRHLKFRVCSVWISDVTKFDVTHKTF
jgi:hypothetical protein